MASDPDGMPQGDTEGTLVPFFSFMTSLRRILKIVPESENKVS